MVSNLHHRTWPALLLLMLLTGACAPFFHQPFTQERARLGAEVKGNAELLRLPEPQEKVVVAVYKFRDQTGQYKPTLNGSSFSTAITQGATSILLRALEESRWFNPIERENLGNLLNERKIIRSTRAEFTELTGRREPPLPPLLFAGVILEGGIISYDANMITGGAGLRYFGAGASGQYRQDRVTIYLRAISTSNGQVLKTVYTTKTILSQQVDASLFRFVSFKKLLETETGFTYNEPTEMAVKEAIEKSVQALVFEGIKEGLWSPRNPEDRNGRAMAEYFQEKNENQHIDVLGRSQTDRRGRLGLGLSAAAVRYAGDYRNPLLRPGAELTLRYAPNPARKLSTALNVGYFELGAGDYYRERFSYVEVCGLYRLFPKDAFTPYLLGGLGTTYAANTAAARRILPHAVGGVGMELMPTQRLGLALGMDTHYYLDDELDLLKRGNYGDLYWTVRGSIVLYLGRGAKTTSLNPN